MPLGCVLMAVYAPPNQCHDVPWNGGSQPKDLRLTSFGSHLDYVDLFVVHSCDKLIISNDTFSGIELSEQLKLLAIGKIEIEPYAFRGIRKSPKQFIIQDSQFEGIPENAFVGLTHVDHFWFKNVSIKRIEKNAFNKLSYFNYIYFRHANIAAIDTDAFGGMRHVNYFYMREGINLGIVDDFIFRNSHIDEIMFENANVKATDFALNGVFAKKIELISTRWHTNKVLKQPALEQGVGLFSAKNCTFNRIVPGLFYNMTEIIIDSSEIHHIASLPGSVPRNIQNFEFRNSRIFQWHSHAFTEGSELNFLLFENCQLDKLHSRSIYSANIVSIVIDKSKIAYTIKKLFEKSEISKLLISETQIGMFSGETFADSKIGVLLLNEIKVTKTEDRILSEIYSEQVQITGSNFPRFPKFMFENSNISDLTVLSTQFRGPPTRTSFRGLYAKKLRFTHCEIACNPDDCEINSLFFQPGINHLAWTFEHNRCISSANLQIISSTNICSNSTEIITDTGLSCRRRIEIEECICIKEDTVVVPRTEAAIMTTGDCENIILVENNSPQLHSIYLYRINLAIIQAIPRSIRNFNVLHSSVRFEKPFILQNPMIDMISFNGVSIEHISDSAFIDSTINLLVLNHSRISGVNEKSFSRATINRTEIQSSEIIEAGDLLAHVKTAYISNSRLRTTQHIPDIRDICFQNNSVECRCYEASFNFDHNTDAQLEKSFQGQQLSQNSTLLLHVLCVITAALLLMALNHLSNPDLALLLAVVSAASSLILQAVLLLTSHESKSTVITCVVVWMFCTVLGTVPAGGQSALIPCIIAYFILYTIFTFDLPTTAFLATTLAIIQIVGFVLLPTDPFTIHQLLATLLVHGWCNFIGIYLYTTKDRLYRAGFLNARNALMSQKESAKESDKMGRLLGSALPDHVISAVRNQIGVNVPKLYVEHYNQATVIYARLYGLEGVLGQISVQDAARLLNEFNSKIDLLVKRHSLIRIQSDAIIVVSGVPETIDEHADHACQFAWDLVHILRSFCDATTAELYIKIGVASGSVSAGIVGANKWHYEIVGEAYDVAVRLEQRASPGHILLSEETAQLVEATYGSEKLDDTCRRLIPTARVASTIPNGLLFPSHRRFSLSTLPQAINRKILSSLDEKTDELEEDDGIINTWTLRFNDKAIERSFHLVIDRWFIPALAISIFFLVVYGLYQILVMPRLIATLALIIVTLAAMFIILLMLYVNHFESFCYFITRTAVGHTVSILLIITLLFICGVVNVFSCPPYKTNPVCHNVFYSIVSCVLWMLSTTVFVKYSSLCLLLTLLGGIAIYSVQIFLTHPDLYINYSLVAGWRIEFDLIIGLVALAFVIYIQSRRNERIIRLDFLSLMRSVEEARHLEWFEHVNEKILLNILPHHIAYSFMNRTDPYCHLCHSVGVLSAQIGHPSEWKGEIGMNRLNQTVYQLDKLLESFPGIEKVRSSHCTYIAAVGVLPEITRNIHDTPFTIGDLLASLTNFALTAKQMIEDEGMEVSIGIDCGSALSVVVGDERPRYEVIGLPCIRAVQLMNSASQYGIVVSEEIYLALRPRNYKFAHNHSLTVTPRLTGYVFADNLSTKQKLTNPKLREIIVGNSIDESEDIQIQEEMTQSMNAQMDQSSSSCPPHDPQHFINSLPANATAVGVTAHNPLEMFTSMNSSMSSDMYSIDISVESDSEIEWITPESLMYEKLQAKKNNAAVNNNVSPDSSRRFWPSSKSITYKGDRAKQYSDFSETDLREGSANQSSKMRRKRFRPSLSRNGPKVPNWYSSRTSLNSDLSLQQSGEGSTAALDRLNAAAKRVDRMLMELANIEGFNGNLPEKPFPTSYGAFSASTKSINTDNRRELSSACHTEYDNAESEGACSDSEIVTSSRLEELKSVLRGFGNNSKKNSDEEKGSRKNTEKFLNRRMAKPIDAGNEADIDSNCSSLASSTMFDKLRWKSVHSIGYENEYEFASDVEERLLPPIVPVNPKEKSSVGADSDFLPMDASGSEAELEQNMRQEVEAISRDIYKNFGEYKLASFSDIDG
ncbi:hypothetical protein FO519_002546 [Halicephalobus sp. NKZ332]|nr:hypothetical protein FO519_002546 [Halicephalobus sp. NKZ332]